MNTELPARSAIPLDETWSLDSVFSGEDAWRAALAGVSASIPRIAAYAGRLAESGATLWEALQTRDALFADAYRVVMYAGCLLSVDGTNAASAAMSGEARVAYANLGGAAAYMDPELLAIPVERLEALIAEMPQLEIYRHAFERLRKQASHVRGVEIETLLANAQAALDTGNSVAEAANNADMTFASVETDGATLPVSHSTLAGLMENPATRKVAYDAYADGFLALQNTLAAALQGTVRAFSFEARARGYASGLEMSLDRNHIPIRVYENLIETFQANLPTWHRYWRLRRKAAGGTFRSCDAPVYEHPAPLSDGVAMKYAEACDIILEGMAPLGLEYLEPLRRGLREERWVDRARNVGKGAGAYSSGAPGTRPFIFMSWSDSMMEMSTLAHELGHSMHSYLTFKHQPLVYADYGLFVAEVASNFNQAMVRAHLLKTADRPRRIAVLDEAFSNFHRYLFVMPTLARFEREIHARVEAGGALTAPLLSSRFVELFREGYGGEVDVDQPRLGAGWMNFSHLHAPFYVYQYATGIAAANALADQVLTEGAPAAARYLDFLKAGGSRYPLAALRLAGIDMEQPEPVARGFAILARMVDELEKIVEG